MRLSKGIFWKTLLLCIFLQGSAANAQPAPRTDLIPLIEKEQPLHFAFMRTVNPWSRDTNVRIFQGELHRLFIAEEPPKDSLEAAILRHLNDPKNRQMVMFRKYLVFLRRTLAPAKPPLDPYSRMQPQDPIYFIHSDLYGPSGPMTHINVANLVLPVQWAEKNYHEATQRDGKIIYDYISLADAPERKLVDLWRDRNVFDQFIIHLGLRLVEAEARGQKKGLEAHMGAHTGPEVNLAFGTTWCQNRGFYESWPLSNRALLHELYPRLFRLSPAESLRERDRFLVFSADPWKAEFEPLREDRASWNTPQAVLSSNYMNAAIEYEIWHNSKIQRSFEKSLQVLAKSGSPNLRAWITDWIAQYPEDREELFRIVGNRVRALGTPGAAESKRLPEKSPDLFACMGLDIWIGIPPKFDHVNFNASSVQKMTGMISRLAERMPYGHRQAWIHHTARQGGEENLIHTLAQSIYSERSRRCGQFKDIADVTHFITAFADQSGLKRAALMSMLQVVVESKVDLDHFYAEEHKRLVLIGAYHEGVYP